MSSFKVENMTCGHCERAIKTELTKEDPSVLVEVDLQQKIVRVENLSDEKVIGLLRELGYNSEKLHH